MYNKKLILQVRKLIKEEMEILYWLSSENKFSDYHNKLL